MNKIRHPAKYTDNFIGIFAENLKGCKNVLDAFGGVGKIGAIKKYGYKGKVYCNELEKEWLESNEYGCDYLTYQDAEFLDYPSSFFDAICTSPTYGNRMADHHNAKDGSKRNTYTHCLGHKLSDGNTGAMQWGGVYRQKHERIYKHLSGLLKSNGIFILNISDHIRKGETIAVSEWHKKTLIDLGFMLKKEYTIETPRLKYGRNSQLRCDKEKIYVLQKTS